jgi:hypothetical protein
MTFIDRGNLFAYFQQLITDNCHHRILTQIVWATFTNRRRKLENQLPELPHIRRDTGLPPEHERPYPYKFLWEELMMALTRVRCADAQQINCNSSETWA